MSDWLNKLQDGVRRAQRAVKMTLEREQTAFVLGKVAGNTVRDGDGRTIVAAGDVIDGAIVADAVRSGRLPMLVASVAAANVQDIQERVNRARAATDEGTEQASLDTVEDYARARACVGRIAGLDVTDVRGTVVVPAGARITEEHVRSARSLGLLNALMHSVSVPHDAAPDASGPAAERAAAEATEADKAVPNQPSPEQRPRLPLILPDDRSTQE